MTAGRTGRLVLGRQHGRPIGEAADRRALPRRLPEGPRWSRKVDGLQISNGLAWTADGERMFHADSRGPWIDRWRFDRASGAITERTRFAELDEVGRPDGGSCDAEGFYWSAGVSAGRLNRFAPDGAACRILSRARGGADHAVLRRA